MSLFSQNFTINALLIACLLCLPGCMTGGNKSPMLGQAPPPAPSPEWMNDRQQQRPAPHPGQIDDRMEHWEAARSSMQPEGSAQGMRSHLQPLPPYRGPFTNRHQQLDENAQAPSPFILMGALEPFIPEAPEPIVLYDWEIEEQRFDWSKLDPVHFFTQVRDFMGMGPDERAAREFMRQGREILLSNPDLSDHAKNIQAARLFERAARKWPDSMLEEDALFYAAESYFFADRYTRAALNYETLISKYHSTQHMNTAVRRLFAIGRYWEQLDRESWRPVNVTDRTRPWTDTFGRMKKAYEAIFINDPRGPMSDSAVMALAEAYMARGLRQGDSAFENAAFYYAYLRENYSNSRHIAQAYERELVARKMAYAGKGYDDRSLNQAGRLAERTLLQHAGDPNIDRDVIRELSNEITNQQAARQWYYGQYWDRKREFGAARTYYRRIVSDFPTTPFAQMATNRLNEIADRPDEPRGFEQWINEVLPSNRRW